MKGVSASALVTTEPQQGAEATVSASTLLGRPCVVKTRHSKAYRHPDLDRKLTRERTIQEARCLARCRQVGVDAPAVFFVDLEASRIYMERIEGPSVRDYLVATTAQRPRERVAVFEWIARALAKLHDGGVTHGDLTTSNMMLRVVAGSDAAAAAAGESGGASSDPVGDAAAAVVVAVVMIDFGLGGGAATVEEKAVDLYVLERALLSTHPGTEALFEVLRAEYARVSTKGAGTMVRFEKVRQRGRKRLAFG